MLELLSMFRPFGKWHVLLAICLLDLALILVQVSHPDLSAAQERRLQEILAQQAEVAQSIQETTRQLQAIYQAASLRSQTLAQLEKGMDDLERQIARLKGHAFRNNTVTS